MENHEIIEEEEGTNTMIMYEKVRATVERSAVVVFGMADCCMCHVVKTLLYGLGVGPTVINLDLDLDSDIIAALYCFSGGAAKPLALPAVFVGGKFLGGIESLMASHINGSLIPLLKQAGALWL